MRLENLIRSENENRKTLSRSKDVFLPIPHEVLAGSSLFTSNKGFFLVGSNVYPNWIKIWPLRSLSGPSEPDNVQSLD